MERGWPHHLAPLPSIFADPLSYYLTLECCCQPVTYQAMKNILKLEMGLTSDYYRLFHHVSNDLIERLLQNDGLKENEVAKSMAQQFVQKLISDNHLSFQEELKEKAWGFLCS